MRKDNFIVYLWSVWAVMFLALLVIFGFEQGLWYTLCFTILGFIGFVSHVELNYDKSIKLWSPVPLRLNGMWTFSFYLVEATYMVSPQFLLHQELTKENT